MEPYKNLGGDSGVRAYEIGSDFIRVQFADGAIYRYTNASAGVRVINMMKQLARNGIGLNSFINTYARKLYESKEVAGSR